MSGLERMRPVRTEENICYSKMFLRRDGKIMCKESSV